MMGRTFSAGEDVRNGPNVVVLGHALWSRRYAADPGIVGRTIQINGAAPTRSPASCRRASSCRPTIRIPSLRSCGCRCRWIPASMDHGSHGLYAVGRLKPGATVAAGRGRTARHRRRDDQRGSVPEADAVRHGGAVAHRRSRRLRPPRHLAALRRGRVSAAHRLRERGEPAPRPRRRPPARDCGSCCARRQRRSA